MLAYAISKLGELGQYGDYDLYGCKMGAIDKVKTTQLLPRLPHRRGIGGCLPGFRPNNQPHNEGDLT